MRYDIGALDRSWINCIRIYLWTQKSHTKDIQIDWEISLKCLRSSFEKKVKMIPISLIVLSVWISKLILIKASNEVFNQCIRSPKPNVIKCIGQQTISSLHNLDKMDNFTIVSGLELIRPENARQRSLTEFFVEDPTDFRLVIFFWINLLSFTKIICT